MKAKVRERIRKVVISGNYNAEKEDGMSSSLDGKRILAVDDEPDVLQVIEEQILDACSNCTFETAVTYEEAKTLLNTNFYDVVVLDIMGVRGFDLLDIAVKRNMRVAMLTAHALNPEALDRSYRNKARAYLPKDKLGEIVPLLEDVLVYDFDTGWNNLARKLFSFFTDEFESGWMQKTGLPWNEYRGTMGEDRK